MYSGPHIINSNITRGWTINSSFNDEVLKNTSVWVRFPKLPLNSWNMKTRSRIGSGLYIPLYAYHDCTTKAEWISYARVIEMDITRDMPETVCVQDPIGKCFEQVVTYEWRTIFVLNWDTNTSKINRRILQSRYKIPEV